MKRRGIQMDLRTDHKAEAIKKMKDTGLTWEYTTDDAPTHPVIEVWMPNGYVDQDERHSLCCFDWEDVVKRLCDLELVEE